MKKLFNYLTILFILLCATTFITSCSGVTTPDNPEKTCDFVITFNANDETEAPLLSYQECTKETEIVLTSNKFTRDGYKFIGWSEDKSAKSAQYTDGQKVNFESNTVLYAVWDKLFEITITYNPGYENSNQEKYTQTVTVTEHENFTLIRNTFIREGYIFIGWGGYSGTLNVKYNDTQSINITKDTNLYAVWVDESEVRTITFNANDNSEAPETSKQNFIKNKYIPLKENTFTREGFQFIGWSESPEDYKVQYKDSYNYFESAEDITLYAVWKDLNSYTIVYHANYETAPIKATTQKIDLNFESVSFNKNTFQREGFVFMGWATYESGKVQYEDEYKLTGKYTTWNNNYKHVYAVWLPESETVKIIFNKNDGSENPEQIIQYVDINSTNSNTKLKANTFTREGYEFLGWALNAEDILNEYNDAYYAFPTPKEDVTLYALWQDSSVKTVYYIANYEESQTKFIKETFSLDEESFTIPTNLYERDDFIIYGWGTSPSTTYYNREGSKYSFYKSNTVYLYAIWGSKADTKKITFHINDGSENSETIIQYINPKDTYINLLSDTFLRDGYTIYGWCLSPTDVEYKYRDSAYISTPDTDIDLYALWLDNTKCTIFYLPNYTNAEELPVSQQVSIETGAYPLIDNTFSRPGYKFIGWYTIQNATLFYPEGKEETFYKTTNTPYYYYAQWEPETKAVSITYNINDDSENPDTFTQYYRYSHTDNNTYIAYKKFERENYEFLGWALNPKADNPTFKYYDHLFYTSKYFDSETKEITLYAVWKDTLNYTITFDPNYPSTITENVPEVIKQKVPKSDNKAILQANTFELEGCRFAGWKKSQSYSSILDPLDCSIIDISDDITLYANWIPNNQAVCITYKPNGGEGEEYKQYVRKGESIKLRRNLFTHSQQYYGFARWSKTSTSSSTLSNNTYYDEQSYIKFTEDTTLYAQWEYKGPAEITLHGNGGKTSTGDIKVIQECEANSIITFMKNPFERPGYRFKGWGYNADSTYYLKNDESTVYCSGNEEYYAIWEKNITITFDANGGKNSEGLTKIYQEGISNEYVTLKENEFSYDEYIFSGWSTDSTAKNASYSNNSYYRLNNDITLYAIWKKASINFIFDSNGTGENQIVIPASYNASRAAYVLTLPENNFKKENEIFAGWGISENSSLLYAPGESVSTSIDENKTIYANWRRANINVTYKFCTDSNGPAQFKIETVPYNLETGKYDFTLIDNNLTYDDHTFMGWSTDSIYSYNNLLKPGDSYSSRLADDLNFYGYWKQNKFKINYFVNGMDNCQNQSQLVENTSNIPNGLVKTTINAKDLVSKYEYYTFEGWTSNPTKKYADIKNNDSIYISEDKNLYAYWKLGEIINEQEKVNIPTTSYSYWSFELINQETIYVYGKSDGDLYFFLLDEDNFELYKTGKDFRYITNASKEKNTYIYGSATIPAGKYYYVVENRNILTSKNVTELSINGSSL